VYVASLFVPTKYSQVLLAALQMRQDPREAWLIAQKWPSTAPVQPHPRGKEPRDFMPPTVAEVAAVYKCASCVASCHCHLRACSHQAGTTQQTCKGCTMPLPPPDPDLPLAVECTVQSRQSLLILLHFHGRLLCIMNSAICTVQHRWQQCCSVAFPVPCVSASCRQAVNWLSTWGFIHSVAEGAFALCAPAPLKI
jgi:hypothetical protein